MKAYKIICEEIDGEIIERKELMFDSDNPEFNSSKTNHQGNNRGAREINIQIPRGPANNTPEAVELRRRAKELRRMKRQSERRTEKQRNQGRVLID